MYATKSRLEASLSASERINNALTGESVPIKLSKPVDDIDKLIHCFITSKGKKRFGNYRVDGHRLVYECVVAEEMHVPATLMRDFIERVKRGEVQLVDDTIEHLERDLNEGDSRRVRFLAKRQHIVAAHITTPRGRTTLGNSSTLPLIGRRASFGRVRENRSETEIQRRLALIIPMWSKYIPILKTTGIGNTVHRQKLPPLHDWLLQLPRCWKH